ncbi:Xylose isomerase-like TIM barrel [Lacunisphaera limnophila]|uniref:Xylose isomerase-like TIM barrel n=1 Tax=Lacunisphaera limnophila TaxID=1838286 RepID=A0A1I7PHJ5_9BACT|nr:sugar phosphate isomerase/epimerase family protein [Lacunisphaera limnophila]AOS43079.1 Xylose isomerase-like TIM barrel [Lacunisphaera limnophila]
MSTAVSRRQFLATAAAAPFGVAGALALAAPAGLPAATPAAPAGRALLKTSLNAYSFLELLNANAKDPSQGVDLFKVCDFCADHGFEGVDVTGYFFPGYPGVPDDRYLIRLKRHVFDLGLCFSGTGVRNDFTAADPAVRAEGVERIKAWIEVAAKLGAPTVRAFADSQPPFRNWQQAAGGASRETVEAWMAEALHSCAEHGAKYGVIVAVQNHGDFISSGAEHLSLLQRVGHAWCAAMVDTGKYLTADPYADIALMAPHAVNWQIKETLQSTTTSPRIDMRRLVGIIRASGYRGYVPIETLRMGRADYDSFVEIPRMLAELRAAIAATA